MVGDIDLAAAQATADVIDDAGGVASAARVDVTCTAGLQSLAPEVRGTRGRVDVLHNNVGVVRLRSPPQLARTTGGWSWTPT